MQPRAESPRNSPIAGVLLTNADIDHALGLILLRQRETPLVVYASDETRSALDWIDAVLKPFCRIEWRTKLDCFNQSNSQEFISLGSGLGFRALELQKGTAFQLRDEVSGVSALIAPAVGEMTNELREAANTSALILFDGTFWSEDELRAIRPGARSARVMNHLPISAGSLDFLRNSPARRKIYMHINNTNPIYMPGSSERRQVEQAGIEIGCDGMEIVL